MGVEGLGFGVEGLSGDVTDGMIDSWMFIKILTSASDRNGALFNNLTFNDYQHEN